MLWCSVGVELEVEPVAAAGQVGVVASGDRRAAQPRRGHGWGVAGQGHDDLVPELALGQGVMVGGVQAEAQL